MDLSRPCLTPLWLGWLLPAQFKAPEQFCFGWTWVDLVSPLWLGWLLSAYLTAPGHYSGVWTIVSNLPVVHLKPFRVVGAPIPHSGKLFPSAFLPWWIGALAMKNFRNHSSVRYDRIESCSDFNTPSDANEYRIFVMTNKCLTTSFSLPSYMFLSYPPLQVMTWSLALCFFEFAPCNELC